jgi:hypothetical protein
MPASLCQHPSQPLHSSSSAFFSILILPPYRIRLVILKNQTRLPLRQIENHLGEITVGPCEPRTRVVARVVDLDALVDEAQPGGVVEDQRQAVLDLVVVVGAEDARDLGHGPGEGCVDVRAAGGVCVSR